MCRIVCEKESEIYNFKKREEDILPLSFYIYQQTFDCCFFTFGN